MLESGEHAHHFRLRQSLSAHAEGGNVMADPIISALQIIGSECAGKFQLPDDVQGKLLVEGVIDGSVILSASVLFWREPASCLRSFGCLPTGVLVGEVEVSSEQHNGTKLVHAEAVGLLG